MLLACTLAGGLSPCLGAGPDPLREPLFNTAPGFDFDQPEKTFRDVRELILEHYYSSDLDAPALYWGAIHGMLRHISPPSAPEQARIWTADEYARVAQSLRGQETSIGVQTRLHPDDGSLTVTAVTAGGPADGTLRVHDRIMRIDGHALHGLDVDAIDARLNGGDGAGVRLTVVRDIEVLHLRVAARRHDAAVLEAGMLDDAVAYLGLRRISSGVAAAGAEQLRAWHEAGIRRLVLDLRNNAGGVFLEGLRVAELFLPSGAVLLYTRSREEDLRRYVSSNDSPLDMQVVVLINRGTASAAEALAAALVANGAARLAGMPSFGKATMERTFALDNAMHVRFIVAAMYAPRGQSWHERGLEPAFELSGDTREAQRWLAEPLARRMTSDTQLRGAWRLLR